MNLKRTKRQIEAVNKWWDNKQGTLEFATGVGKTNTAIIAIKKLHKTDDNLTVHVVVPTRYLKTQWEKELKNSNVKHTEVFVINSYLKNPRNTHLLILDEIHNYGSEQRLKVFGEQNTHLWLLGLTATIERKDLMHEQILRHAPIIDKIDLEEARAEGYVSDFIVYNLGIKLSESDKMYYGYLNQNFYKHFNVFGRDFKLAMSCLANKNAREIYGKKTGQKPEDLAFHAVRFNKFMQERKNFLYNIPSKIDLTEKIIKNHSERKTITFSENISFADKLPGGSYHSKLGKKIRENTLNEFNKGTLGILNASKALDEGFDVGDIELVIITSSRAVERVDKQRTGRGIRFREGKLAVIVNLYVMNSKDEDWLRMRQNQSANNIYWITNVNDIKFERPKIRAC